MSNELKDITKIIGKYQVFIFLIFIVLISLITMELILSGLSIIFPGFPEASDMYLILNSLIQFHNTGLMVILSIIYFLCPAIVAIIMLAVIEGQKGVLDLFKGLLKWKIDIKWYIIAMFLPVVIELLTVLIYPFTGNTIPGSYSMSLLPWNIHVPHAMAQSEISSLSPNAIISLISWNISMPILGNIPGALLIPLFMMLWSLSLAVGLYGYALPRLLKRCNPLISAAILGIFIVFITIPLLINNPNIIVMILGLFVSPFLVVWLWSVSQNNTLLVAIFLFFLEYMPNLITYYIAHYTGNNLAVYINKMIIVVITLAVVISYKDYFLKKIRVLPDNE